MFFDGQYKNSPTCVLLSEALIQMIEFRITQIQHKAWQRIKPVIPIALDYVNLFLNESLSTIGRQRFVDIIDYVDYKNVLISMECVDASLATPIAWACSYHYLRLPF